MKRKYGQLLKQYRMRTIDPDKQQRQISYLSIHKFARLTREKIGTYESYPSHSIVGAWETGKRSPPSTDKRFALIAMLWVLYKYEGITSSIEANQLLRLAGHADLSKQEITSVFFEDGTIPPVNSPTGGVWFESPNHTPVYEAVNRNLKRGLAREALGQLEEHRRQFEDVESENDYIRLLGKTHLMMGQIDTSRDHLLRLGRIAKRDSNPALLAESNINLGIIAMYQFDWQAALDRLQTALRIAEDHQIEIQKAYAHAALAAIFTEKKKWGNALGHYNSALAIARKIHHVDLVISIQLNKSVMDYYRGNMQAVLTGAEYVNEISIRFGHTEYMARSLWLLGATRAAEGERYESERDLKIGIALANDGGFQRVKGLLSVELAKVYIRDRLFQDAGRMLDNLLSELSPSTGILSMVVYGKALIHSLQYSYVGHNDLYQARRIVHPVLDRLLRHAINLDSVDANSLLAAQDFFSYGLRNYPNLERYRVVEAIEQYLDLNHLTRRYSE